MPIEILDKRKCTGCEACSNICPKSCINMKSDNMGFSYPVIDFSECINCNMCVHTCPLQYNLDITVTEKDIDVYASWSLNKDIRYNSTSGGLFSEISKIILQRGGYIVGAAYNTSCDVEHIIVSDYSGLERIRQSKYTQSTIGYLYRNIRELLMTGNEVLFCGAPCQAAGLKQYLKKNYENLVIVDFICRGMNSPKAYRYWLNELQKQYNSKAINVWFKYKINGWKKSPTCTRIDFQNGKSCVQNGYNNIYMKGYLGPNLYIRPSCGECHFKSFNRYSDITLADFWGIAKKLDDDQGTSLILVNSEKGRHLFDQCRGNIFYEKRELQEILKGNGCFEESVKINPKSEEFLRRLGEKPFSSLVKEYARVSFSSRIKNKAKRVIKKILMNRNGDYH